MTETLFATLKTDFNYWCVWPTKKAAQIEVGKWIEDRYNRRRRLPRSGQITPVAFDVQIVAPDRGLSKPHNPFPRDGAGPGRHQTGRRVNTARGRWRRPDMTQRIFAGAHTVCRPAARPSTMISATCSGVWDSGAAASPSVIFE